VPSEGQYIYARIDQHASGRWEVQTAIASPGARAWTWKLARLVPSEQQAESYARSLLPYCNQDWHPKTDETSWTLFLAEFPAYRWQAREDHEL